MSARGRTAVVTALAAGLLIASSCGARSTAIVWWTPSWGQATTPPV